MLAAAPDISAPAERQCILRAKGRCSPGTAPPVEPAANEPGVWGRTGHPCGGNVMASRTPRDRGDLPLARPGGTVPFPSPDPAVAWSRPGDWEPLVSQPLPSVCRATAGDNSALIISFHSSPPNLEIQVRPPSFIRSVLHARPCRLGGHGCEGPCSQGADVRLQVGAWVGRQTINN